jgi:transposase
LPASTAAAALRKRFELINEFRAMLEVDATVSDKRAAASRIIVVPKPPSAIPGGEAGPNLLSQTIISKYADHLPLYRLERIFGRHGVGFSRSTLCDWVSRCASVFKSLLAALREEVLKSFVIHTDDTPVDVRDSRAKEKYQARFWTYWGDNEHPFVWFDFTTNRKRQGPDAVLRAFRGYLQADGYGGYSGYEGVMLSDDTPILKVACWVHARRKFRDAMSSDPVRAALAISYIARLYEIEKMIKRELAQSEPTMSTEDQYRFIASRRQELAVPVLTEFRKWIDGPMPGVLPKSLLSKALVYVQNQWDALMRYVEDGRLQPDNNTAERALRGIALGRKAWLFCGSAIGGQTAATHFSLIASAVRNGLEPYQYLSCLLEELPLLGDKPTREQLLPYMPNVWRPYNGDSSL